LHSQFETVSQLLSWPARQCWPRNPD